MDYLPSPDDYPAIAQLITALDQYGSDYDDRESLWMAANHLSISIERLDADFQCVDVFGLIGCIVENLLDTDEQIIECRQYLPENLRDYLLTKEECDRIDWKIVYS